MVYMGLLVPRKEKAYTMIAIAVVLTMANALLILLLIHSNNKLVEKVEKLRWWQNHYQNEVMGKIVKIPIDIDYIASDTRWIRKRLSRV